MMLPEDVAINNASLFCSRNVVYASGEDGITVISSTVSSQEANEALCASVSTFLGH